ncbi:MAG TPA: hypothetical protein VJZ71_14925 [Phycisphaerae bacterium]|nr:hypothetical protein [Phycisphaerae bacterium]
MTFGSQFRRAGSARRFCRTTCYSVPFLLLAACQQQDQKKWDEFWKVDSNRPLFGKQVGDAEIWTIECNDYRSASREEREQMADNMARLLKKRRELRADDVWVQNEADRSRIFYGQYPLKYVEARTDTDDHAQGDVIIELNEEIRRDLDFIRKLALGDKYPFFSARPTVMPTEHVGPPEWDLQSARGVYTLNIGVTYNTETLHNYKEAAVEWVRDLRNRGYDAYYYHDPDRPLSSICVGTFGEDALVDDGQGKKRMSPAVIELRNKEEFKYNLENGHIIYRSAVNEAGQKGRIPNWSFLVRIPRTGESSDLQTIPTGSGG